MVSNVLTWLGVCLCGSFLLTAVHEGGHAIGARLVGLPVFRYKVWGGASLVVIYWKKLQWEIGWIPCAGIVTWFSTEGLQTVRSSVQFAGYRQKYAGWLDELDNEARKRASDRAFLKKASILLAGPFAELTVSCTLLWLFASLPREWGFVLPARVVVLFHAMLAVSNLVWFPLPFSNGLGSDGLLIAELCVIAVYQFFTGRLLERRRVHRWFCLFLYPLYFVPLLGIIGYSIYLELR